MLEPRIMPARYASFFMFMLVHNISSPLWSHFWPFIMPVFVDYARDVAIFRYFLLLNYAVVFFTLTDRASTPQCMCSSMRVWFLSLIIPRQMYGI